MVDGLVALMQSNYTKPVNLGNPDERKVTELADIVRKELAPGLAVLNKPPVRDDPQRRRPDISVAKTVLGWKPKVPFRDGLRRTFSYFKEELACAGQNSEFECGNHNFVEKPTMS